MPRKRNVVDVRPASDALGQDKISDIASKEWKKADLPLEQELALEDPQNPKARNNINSRKNLVQYREDIPKETKEAIVSNLKFKSKRRDFDLEGYFAGVLSKDMFCIFVPMRDALEDADEEDVFFGTIKFFMRDFPKEELSASDIDDVANLALNRILELRLLKEAKTHPKRILDIAASIERFRKNSEKIKMSLASRRMDRIDVKNKVSFSIVDIANQFDAKRKAELTDRADRYREEERKFLEEKKRSD